MIPKRTLEDAMYQAMKLATTKVPPDVRAALERVMDEETDPLAG